MMRLWRIGHLLRSLCRELRWECWDLLCRAVFGAWRQNYRADSIGNRNCKAKQAQGIDEREKEVELDS